MEQTPGRARYPQTEHTSLSVKAPPPHVKRFEKASGDGTPRGGALF